MTGVPLRSSRVLGMHSRTTGYVLRGMCITTICVIVAPSPHPLPLSLSPLSLSFLVCLGLTISISLVLNISRCSIGGLG